MKMKNILFVCKHNRFRSKIAEAYFNKINKNKKIKACSAGIFKGFPVHKNVISLGKKFGINIKKETQGLSEELVKKIDIIIIVANNVPSSLFRGKVKKIIVWKIPDANQNNKKKMEGVIKLVIKKVNKLIKELNEPFGKVPKNKLLEKVSKKGRG